MWPIEEWNVAIAEKQTIDTRRIKYHNRSLEINIHFCRSSLLIYAMNNGRWKLSMCLWYK